MVFISVTSGSSLLALICHNHDLVTWALAHGADPNPEATEADQPPTSNNPLPPTPVLETIASKGSVRTVKLLRTHGARLGRRCLHRAVESAAFATAAPRTGKREEDEEKEKRMEMVKHLVEVEGADVNALDVDVEVGEKRPNHWGTPIAYAVHASSGGGASREVVELLLKVNCALLGLLSILFFWWVWWYAQVCISIYLGWRVPISSLTLGRD